MKTHLLIIVACLLSCALPDAFVLHAQEFEVTYSGQVSRTWNWSDGSRDRITLNAAGTVRVRPHQVTTSDGQTFLSYTADLDTTNHVWGTAIEDGSVPTYALNFDATRLVSRSPSSTYSHFTPQTASYLYFETEDSVYAPPDDITVYAWEYVSSQQVLRLWVALSDPFYYPDDSYEHYDFPATQVVSGQSSAHSCLLGTAVDSQGTPVPGAQVVFGGLSRTTDTQGKFQYDDIPPVNYLLTITKSGYNGFTNVETIPPFSILQGSYTLGCARLTLLGRVLDASTRQPLSGVSLTVAGQDTTTPGSGEFSFTDLCLTSGSPLTASKSGFQTKQLPLSPPQGAVEYVVPDIYLATNGSFTVVSIKPKYDGLFLSGASIPNEYTATVSWGNRTPGGVEFSVNNGPVQTVATTTDVATAQINMAFGFFGSLTLGANKVRAVAVDSLGERSASFEQAVTILPAPAFLLSGQALLPFGWVGGSLPELQFKLSWPPDQYASGDLINIPYFDSVSCSFGVETEFTYKVLSGEWDFKFGGTSPEWKWGNWKPHVAVGVTGSGLASATQGVVVQDVGATFTLDAEAPILTVYILDLLPGGEALHVLDVLRVVGVDINSIQRLGINGIAKIQASPKWNYETWKYKDTTIGETLGARAYYQPNILGSSLEMSVILNGNWAIRFGDSFAWQLQGQAAFRLRANVWTLLNYDQTFVLLDATLSSANWALLSPLTRAAMGGGATQGQRIMVVVTESVTPRPMDRCYLNAGPERFVADNMSKQAKLDSTLDWTGLASFRLIGQASARGSVMAESETNGKSDRQAYEPKDAGPGAGTNQVDLTLVQNVFPNSQPALAGRSNELMLLYVTDNGSSNDLQFTDIKWMRWDGTNWSAPLAIQTNTQAEFAPQVAYDGYGDAIAVWERVADPNFNQTNLTAMAAQMEIVWSRWSRTNGAWSEPAALTANSYLHHAPLLCGPMSDGSVLAVWTANQQNLLMGTNVPGNDTVWWAHWSAASRSWGTPQVLVEGLAYRLSQSLAGAGKRAVYAWTRDADGVLTNDTDQEVFFMEYTNSVWGAPRQLTTNTVADKTVRAAVATNGNVFLVWQSGTNLVLSQNFSTNLSIIRPDSQTAGFADYDVTVGPLGHLVLLWQEMSTNGSDAHYMVYDPVAAAWGKDDLLCQDPPLERSFAPVWDNVGNLTVAYDKVQILYTNLTVTVEGGGTVTITNVPQPGRVDLVVTKRALVKDLALQAGDFSVQGVNYLPGDPLTLSATVHNSGNVAVSNVVVGFYDGNPDMGGVLLTNVTLAGWLAAATSAVASTVWVVTEPATNHTLYAVANRAGLASEFNGSNNEASVSIGRTDLSVSLSSYSAETNGAMHVIVMVQNLGARSATNSVLAIRRYGSTNSPLATVAVPMLKAGLLAQLALDLPPGTQPAGEQIYTLTADENHVTGDVDTNNNTCSFAVNLWIDSDGDGIPDNWMMQYFGHATELASDLSRAQDDADGDGLSNLAEYLAGTNPRDAHSYLSITGIGLGGTNGVQITWGSAPNRLYSLQRAAAVSGGLGFTNIAEHILSTPPENVYLDATATNSPSLFYRVKVE
jgi:hypothetical protein